MQPFRVSNFKQKPNFCFELFARYRFPRGSNLERIFHFWGHLGKKVHFRVNFLQNSDFEDQSLGLFLKSLLKLLLERLNF